MCGGFFFREALLDIVFCCVGFDNGFEAGFFALKDEPDLDEGLPEGLLERLFAACAGPFCEVGAMILRLRCCLERCRKG